MPPFSQRDSRTARAEAGVMWIEVVEAAAQHGLAALAGASPDVRVVGYTLGAGYVSGGGARPCTSSSAPAAW
jgi:FAD/FMN-containing dehydrogenase